MVDVPLLQRLRRLDSPSARGALVAILAFVAMVAPFQLTPMADDWTAFSDVYRGTRHVGTMLTRVPVSALIGYLTIRPAVWEHGWPLMYVFFAVHAAGATLVATALARRLGQEPVDESGRHIWAFALAVTALYAGHFEILFWPSCMAFTVGLPLLGLALWVRAPAGRVALLALSFLTYETFVLPALAALLLPALLRPSERGRLRDLAAAAWPWAAALAATLAVRAALGALSGGSYAHSVTQEPARMLAKALGARDSLTDLVFYGRDPWPTRVQHLGLALLAAAALGMHRLRGLAAVLVGALAVFASTAVYWVLEYFGPRALYGSASFAAALLAVLAVTSARRRWSRVVVVAALVCLATAYVWHTVHILATKDHNAAVLARLEREVCDAAAACPGPCTVHIPPPNRGLRHDWTLHQDYWPGYLDVLAVRCGGGRDLRVEVAGESTVVAASPRE